MEIKWKRKWLLAKKPARRLLTSTVSISKTSPLRLSVLFSLKCGLDHFSVAVILKGICSSHTILFLFNFFCTLSRFYFKFINVGKYKENEE